MPYTLERSAEIVDELINGDPEKAVEMHNSLPDCDLDGCRREGGLNYHDGDYCSTYHHFLDQ